MPQLLVAVIGEGPSDDALIPIIEWVLERPALGLLPSVDTLIRFVYPDEEAESAGMVERIIACADAFPCALLIVHHDADGPTHTAWGETIRHAVGEARRLTDGLPPCVPVVPVRELEAWLLLDEAAIRQAAGAPDGPTPLHLPRPHEIEACPDPKTTLRDALRDASGLSRRRRSQIDTVRPRDVVRFSRSFEPLRQLPAFQAFEEEVRRVIEEQGWPERLG